MDTAFTVKLAGPMSANRNPRRDVWLVVVAVAMVTALALVTFKMRLGV